MLACEVAVKPYRLSTALTSATLRLVLHILTVSIVRPRTTTAQWSAGVQVCVIFQCCHTGCWRQPDNINRRKHHITRIREDDVVGARGGQGGTPISLTWIPNSLPT